MGTNTKTTRTTVGKALEVNQDPAIYGAFAEIGAGQEVARHFFLAGQASQTIAKTMSAYDMIYSDEIYGKEANGRYVCESRLIKMLDKEFSLLQRRLDANRGERTQFFAYANTVTTGDQTKRYCHGWMGVRFQKKPKGPFNDIILHVRMLDRYRLQQQEILGILGVNLVHSAFRASESQADLIPALTENIRDGQVAIDLIRTSGPDLAHLNNHLLNLELVRRKLAEGTVFGPNGDILSASDVLYQKPAIIDRGEFRPVTKTHLDLVERGFTHFKKEFPKAGNPVVLFEIPMHSLLQEGTLDEQDFLDRVETLRGLGHCVLVTNFLLFYRLKHYLRSFTKEPIAILIRAPNLTSLFDESIYGDLEGGLMEGLGKLLDTNTRVFAFPQLKDNQCLMANAFEPEGKLKPIFQYFRQQSFISDLGGCESMKEEDFIRSEEVRKLLQKDDPKWEKLVPKTAAAVIKEKGLFGYKRSSKK